MTYRNIVGQADLVFYERCKKGSSGKSYFEKINYDKTLNERSKRRYRNPQELASVTEFINSLETTIRNVKSVVACRITGSFPVLLDGEASKDVEETISDDKITLKAKELFKKPDIDIEVVVKSFVGRDYFSIKKELLKIVPVGHRISMGYIDRGSICIHNIRNIIRWGFIRNEQIIKGESWYKEQSKNIWDYLYSKPESYKNKVLSLVGALHIYYALKNRIKYGKIDTFTIMKSENPDIYNAVAEWKKCKNNLFCKEDLE